jgi:hypothetical protein
VLNALVLIFRNRINQANEFLVHGILEGEFLECGPSLWAFCLALIFFLACLNLNLSAKAAEAELPDGLYREVMSSCITSMSKNIVSNPVAKAYCFCYVDQLGKTMTEKDFERMDNYGVNDFDTHLFQAAAKNCNPQWSLFNTKG